MKVPFAAKIGVLYSYRLTILFIVAYYAGVALALAPAGSDPRVFNLFFINVGMYGYPILLILTVYCLRGVLKAFDSIFHVYSHARRRETGGLSTLFLGQAQYRKFNEHCRAIVDSRKEYIAVVLLPLAYILLGHLQDVPTLGLAYREVNIHPWTDIAYVWTGFMLVIGFASTGSVGWLFLSMVAVIRRFGRERDTLKAWRTSKSIAEREYISSARIMPYREFYSRLRPIGMFAYRTVLKFSLVLVGLIVVAVFSDIVRTGGMDRVTLVLSVLSSAGIVFAFIIPQISIHSLMRDVKEKYLKGLESMYDELQKVFLSGVVKKGERGKHKADRESLLKNMTIIHSLIDSANETGTWPFKGSMFLKILVTALIPSLLSMLQNMIFTFLLA